MRPHWGAMTPAAQRLFGACVWAVLIMAVLVSLPFLVHVLNRGMDWITNFPLIRERWLERLLWTR